MGLDTIAFFGTSAAAMTVMAPTTAVIKGNTGDAYIVGVYACCGTDNLITMTCAGDPRWEAAGVRFGGMLNFAATSVGQSWPEPWLPTKIPIKCGATLTMTQVGADDALALVYVEYPNIGDAFRPRDPMQNQPVGFEVYKSVTASGACTALGAAILQNGANITSFQRGKVYTPVRIEGGTTALATPHFVGLQNTKYNLMTMWPVKNTPFDSTGLNTMTLPYGIGTIDGGETLYLHFADYTAETVICDIVFAYV
jgi:hypothetical protein